MLNNRLCRVSVCALLTLIAGAPCTFAADAIVHQVSLPSGMTWCDDTMINGLFTNLNAFRGENGIPALRLDSLGMKDAELRAIQFATYMVTNPPGSPGFDPHTGWNTTAASIGYNVISENLAYMTSDPRNIVYSVWQGPLHKSAMLASDANVAGVSCVYSNGTPYWTYEPGRSLATNPTPAPAPTDEATAFLTLINQYRAQNGLNPVQVSPKLTAAATWMSNDMATKNYTSHTDSLGRSVGVRLAAFDYTYYPYGENIAGGFGDALTTFNQWRDACDPDASGACTYAHRKTMLGTGFVAIGIGRTYNANSAYGWYWVTDFGGFLDTSTPVPPPATAPVISAFLIAPSGIIAGQSATLSWNVTGATSVTIDNGVGSVAGTASKIVSPTQTTTYRLTATNGAGTATAATTITVTPAPAPDTQRPSTPGLVTVIAKSATSVALTWTASMDNVRVTGYQVLRNNSPAAVLGGTVLTFTDSVAANTTYTYSIRAFDAAGNYSDASNSVQVTTPIPPTSGCPAPAQNAFTGCYYNSLAMTGTPALVRTDARIDFDWYYTAPAPAITSGAYSVKWQGVFALSAGAYTFSVMVSDGIRLYIDGNLLLDRWRDQPLTIYYVRPTLSAGNHTITVEYYQNTGSARANVSWTNTSPAPAVPVISSFTANPLSISAGQSTNLAWAVSGATTLTIDNGVGTVTGLNGKSIAPAQTTTYKLTATNANGSSTASVTVSVSSAAVPDTQPPTAPGLKSAVAVSASRVDLVWTASTDNKGVTGYRVSRNSAVVASVPGSTLSFSDTGVSPNTSYSYSVQALDAAGNTSVVSTVVKVTTPAITTPTTCAPGTNVFTGCYYNNVNLTGTPVLIRTDRVIDFDWMYTSPDPRIPNTDYSVRWQGTFEFLEGSYSFNATASDGMRIYIDDQLILDRWRDQPVYQYVVRPFVSAGRHLITVEYYERTRTATARLSWQKN